MKGNQINKHGNKKKKKKKTTSSTYQLWIWPTGVVVIITDFN